MISTHAENGYLSRELKCFLWTAVNTYTGQLTFLKNCNVHFLFHESSVADPEPFDMDSDPILLSVLVKHV